MRREYHLFDTKPTFPDPGNTIHHDLYERVEAAFACLPCLYQPLLVARTGEHDGHQLFNVSL